MRWENCLKSNKVRKASPDPSLAKALIIMSERRLGFLRQQALTAENASIIFVEHYEMLREILEAVISLRGYKAYSHECLGYFLKETLGEELLAIKFDRFRMLRNGVNYYGEPVSIEETAKAMTEMTAMAAALKERYLTV